MEYKAIVKEILAELRCNEEVPPHAREFFNHIFIQPETVKTEDGLYGAIKVKAETANKGDLTFIVSTWEPDFDGQEPPDEVYEKLIMWLVGEKIKDCFEQFTIHHQQTEIQSN